MPGVVLPGALVLVTGAGQGIGRATALAFARRGARVLCADLDAAAAAATAGACAATGAGDGEPRTVDVADRRAVLALAAQVHDEHGPLHVLVNNAGVGVSGHFVDTPLDDWEWLRGVNLDGVVHGCAAFGPAMVARGRGQVVNLASALAYTPTASEWAYVTTKAAVLMLSRSLRADWRGTGVGVTAVCPGLIATDIVERTRFRGERADPDTVDRIRRTFRRGHPPERVAAAVVAAVDDDPAVVPVGAEARLTWWLARLGPVRLQQWLAGRLGR